MKWEKNNLSKTLEQVEKVVPKGGFVLRGDQPTMADWAAIALLDGIAIMDPRGGVERLQIALGYLPNLKMLYDTLSARPSVAAAIRAALNALQRERGITWSETADAFSEAAFERSRA